MKKEKKKWETPKLICLYRGRPEEAVLVGCKIIATQPGPDGICISGGGKKCKDTSGT